MSVLRQQARPATGPVAGAETPRLPVRSAVLSVLLGAHPRPVPAADLARAAALFELSPGSVRVALTRAVATGDLRRTDDGYLLGERLLHRQRRQQEAVEAAPGRWDGGWEAAAAVVPGRPHAQRAALRSLLLDSRLAELREGLWMRPANLSREPGYAGHPDLVTFRAEHDDPAAVAARLWDLDAWAGTGLQLQAGLVAARVPADRLARAAALVRHLASDPILPDVLLPTGWPGAELRATYAGYQEELRDLVGL